MRLKTLFATFQPPNRYFAKEPDLLCLKQSGTVQLNVDLLPISYHFTITTVRAKQIGHEDAKSDCRFLAGVESS